MLDIDRFMRVHDTHGHQVAQPFNVNAGAPIRITVSIGIASWPAHADNTQAVVAAAGAALYSAKQGGRNRTICYQPATQG